MKNNAKPIVALLSGAIFLLGGFCQSTQAQGIITLGQSYTQALATDTGSGTDVGPEAVTVTTKVTESAGVYTYTYVVNNPTGDVIQGGQNNGQPETVGSFTVGFNTTLTGAYVSGSYSGGTLPAFIGVTSSAIDWSFAAVSPGSSSPILSFQSDEAPTWGNASASDSGNQPSPWASAPNGNPVLIPSPVPEPTTMSLFAGCLLLMPFRSIIVKKAWKK
jgi:hypothetical protein